MTISYSIPYWIIRTYDQLKPISVVESTEIQPQIKNEYQLIWSKATDLSIAKMIFVLYESNDFYNMLPTIVKIKNLSKDALIVPIEIQFNQLSVISEDHDHVWSERFDYIKQNQPQLCDLSWNHLQYNDHLRFLNIINWCNANIFISLPLIQPSTCNIL